MLPADRMRLFLRACTSQHTRLADGVLAKTCRGVHFCTRPAHPRPTSRRHLPNGTIKQSLRRPMKSTLAAASPRTYITYRRALTRVQPSARARQSSPCDTASDTLKSGDHWRSAAKPQNEARILLTEGSLP